MNIKSSLSGSPADSTSRSISPNEAYENLANAIVIQAIRDYQRSTSQSTKAYIRKWLTSEDSPCRDLTGLSGAFFEDNLDDFPANGDPALKSPQRYPKTCPKDNNPAKHLFQSESHPEIGPQNVFYWVMSPYNIHGLHKGCLYHRLLRQHMTLDEALNTPMKKKV